VRRVAGGTMTRAGASRSADAGDRSAPRGPLAYGTTRFALFGEVLLTGVIVAVLSLPVITLVPALAVGVRHLRRHLVGEADSARRLLRDLPPAVRDLWPLGLLSPVVLALLAFNVWLARAGLVPSGQVVLAVSAAVGVVVVVVPLRVAGTWEPGRRGWPTVRAAAGRARGDVAGSFLLLAAVLMSAVLVWMLIPLVLVVGGLLAFAVLAVEHRLGSPEPDAVSPAE